MKCELCGCNLITRNKVQYGKIGAECHISRHHYFPKRFNKFFNEKEIKQIFNIENKNSLVNLCYNCHEELIHNIVLNSKIIKKLKDKMQNKNIRERIIILYKQLLK